MATKLELLKTLQAAGVEGYSMANLHAELADAVTEHDLTVTPEPEDPLHARPHNRAHKVRGV